VGRQYSGIMGECPYKEVNSKMKRAGIRPISIM
jgi:hypothetical protein